MISYFPERKSIRAVSRFIYSLMIIFDYLSPVLICRMPPLILSVYYTCSRCSLIALKCRQTRAPPRAAFAAETFSIYATASRFSSGFSMCSSTFELRRLVSAVAATRVARPAMRAFWAPFAQRVARLMPPDYSFYASTEPSTLLRPRWGLIRRPF